MDRYRALRLRAMQAVEHPDSDDQLRSIFRWYSRTFHTPLHLVEELPVDDVLSAYYEESYEGMNDEERKRETAELLETPEQKKIRLRQKDEERAEAFEFARIAAEEERRKEDRKRLADLKPEGAKPLAVQKTPEASLPKPLKDLKELPPDIEMKFVDDAEFEKEIEGFGTMKPSGKPQSSP